MFGRATVLSLGYHALHAEYDHRTFEWGVTQHRPIIGTALQF